MNAPQAALVRRAGRTWEVVIGLETHVQLATASKMFSGATTAFGAEPNTQACAIDLALPGVLPVANRAAVACAIRFGLAVGAQIATRSGSRMQRARWQKSGRSCRWKQLITA